MAWGTRLALRQAAFEGVEHLICPQATACSFFRRLQAYILENKGFNKTPQLSSESHTSSLRTFRPAYMQILLYMPYTPESHLSLGLCPRVSLRLEGSRRHHASQRHGTSIPPPTRFCQTDGVWSLRWTPSIPLRRLPKGSCSTVPTGRWPKSASRCMFTLLCIHLHDACTARALPIASPANSNLGFWDIFGLAADKGRKICLSFSKPRHDANSCSPNQSAACHLRGCTAACHHAWALPSTAPLVAGLSTMKPPLLI